MISSKQIALGLRPMRSEPMHETNEGNGGKHVRFGLSRVCLFVCGSVQLFLVKEPVSMLSHFTLLLFCCSILIFRFADLQA